MTARVGLAGALARAFVSSVLYAMIAGPLDERSRELQGGALDAAEPA